MALNDHQDARTSFRRALVRQPDDANVHMSLGDLALATGASEDAVRHYRLALAAQPDASRLYYQLGLALRNSGDAQAAREALAKRGERYPAQHDPWMAAVQEMNLNSDRFYQRGSDLAAAGNYRAAVRQFERAAELGPDEPGYRAALAQALSAAGEIEQALEVISAARQRWPDDPELMLQLGMAHELLGHEEDARRWYRLTFESGADYPIAGIRLAHSFLREARWDEAIALYDRVLNDYGASPDARYWRAMARVASGQCEVALEDLRQVVAADPADPRGANSLARVLSTCPAADANDRAQALDAARALHAYRATAEHATTLAMALAANGEWEAAEQRQLGAISALLAGDPNGLLPWYNTLHALFAQGTAPASPWPEGHPALSPRLSFAAGP